MTTIDPSLILGVEAKAKICPLEETAIIYRRWKPSVKGLSARWLELVGTLLVQVILKSKSLTFWSVFFNKKV